MIDDSSELLSLITKIYEDESENKMWLLYCNIYPHMTEKSYVTFDEFSGKKKKLKKEVTEVKKSSEDILKDIELITMAKSTKVNVKK